MKHQTEAPISESDIDEDDIEWVSKSQLKRDSKALQDLGKKLCAYNADQLAKVPLDDKLLDAIALAHKIANKRGALKRHFQFIGKLLRNIDVEPILQAVEAIEQADKLNKQHFKQLEYWRDRILELGDPAINEMCADKAQMDRQKLRQLWRNHNQAPTDEKKVKFARQLFKALRESFE